MNGLDYVVVWRDQTSTKVNRARRVFARTDAQKRIMFFTREDALQESKGDIANTASELIHHLDVSDIDPIAVHRYEAYEALGWNVLEDD